MEEVRLQAKNVCYQEEVLIESVKAQSASYLNQGPPQTANYYRPKNHIFYCFKTAWTETLNESNFAKLKKLENCVPDRWENVRYRLERKLDMHLAESRNRVTSFLSARQIVNFEVNSLAVAKELDDDDFVDEQAVLILFRHPSTHGIGHFVPLDMIREWRLWFLKSRAEQNLKIGRKLFNVRPQDFYTNTHGINKSGRWFPQKMLHASSYITRPPLHWPCPRCQHPGVHWESQCDTPVSHFKNSKLSGRKVHGIPKSLLTKVNPDSFDGHRTILQDSHGNLYRNNFFETPFGTSVELGIGKRKAALLGHENDERDNSFEVT